MAIGLAQGLVLYVLFRHWTDKDWLTDYPMLFRGLSLMALFIPPLGISALSHMRPRQLVSWLLLLAALIAGLGIYDLWRADIGIWLMDPALSAWQKQAENRLKPSALLILLLVPGLFMAQAMALAGEQDRRWIASYRSYFAWAWKLALQLSFAALFNAVMWLILLTGAQLFELLKMDFLATLIRKHWFTIPVSAMAFAAALHLTDVKPAIIVSLRKLLLTMLSWLLPLAALIATGFLAGLCVTGLEPLWETRNATAVLLGTTALLVILINMVYQDGLSAEAAPPRVISWSLRLSCVLPSPLVVLAAYALGLRVNQYGWTPERIYATLCIAVAAIYAVGYLAALRRAAHMGTMAPVNVGTSFAILTALVLILTPIADPARLAVADQLSRLASGQITVQQLDVKFMRYEGERYGVRALAEIAKDQDPQLASLNERIQRALKSEHVWDLVRSDKPGSKSGANMRMHPEGATWPAGITDKTWSGMMAMGRHTVVPPCVYDDLIQCDVYVITPPGARSAQLLLISKLGPPPALLAEDAKGEWQIVGTFPMSQSCISRLQQALEANTLQWKVVTLYDLNLGKILIPMRPTPTAPARCDQ